MIENARFLSADTILATIDGTEMIVPDDMANRHRQMLAAWVADGRTIDPFEPPDPTLEDYRRAIQSRIDETAQAKSYDSGNSLASYVASTNPHWAAEAHAFVGWRDAVWSYAYAELDKVMNGEREQPSVDEFVEELPVIDAYSYAPRI